MAERDYAEFLRQKIKLASFNGFSAEPGAINPILYPHQRDIVRWAVQGGNLAIFAKFGLGKSVMQCEWLIWFDGDNDMGAAGYRASPGNGHQRRAVRTIEDLARLIVDGRV